jgi:hypothetical protein
VKKQWRKKRRHFFRSFFQNSFFYITMCRKA